MDTPNNMSTLPAQVHRDPQHLVSRHEQQMRGPFQPKRPQTLHQQQGHPMYAQQQMFHAQQSQHQQPMFHQQVQQMVQSPQQKSQQHLFAQQQPQQQMMSPQQQQQMMSQQQQQMISQKQQLMQQQSSQQHQQLLSPSSQQLPNKHLMPSSPQPQHPPPQQQQQRIMTPSAQQQQHQGFHRISPQYPSPIRMPMNPSYPSSPLSPTQQRMQQLPFYPNPRLQSPNANTPPNRGPTSPPITPGRLDLSTSPINGSSSPASSMDNRKMRRRTGSTKSGTFQIKRSDEAPVTLQGWLYKQGHEGLMLWKKRWFVLSEFVLYYYKSPEEERTSGSILLPSYKISPIQKDNGISRKFAFKAEHKNMRTYHFAAESKDTMIQWMNAMSLASIGEQEQGLSKIQRMPNDNNQSMRHSSHVHNHPPVVHQMFSPNGNAYQYHPKDNQMSPGGMQPLYANAPPKPRRMNTSRDQSPSPERQMEEGMMSPTSDPMMVTGRYHHPMTEVHQAHIIVDDVPPSYRMRPPQERRTPEAYGRMSRMQRTNQIDYEDVYNRQNAMIMQQQQQQPMYQQQQQQLAMHQSAVQLAQMRTGMSRQQMARPHSADFLEYDPPKMAPQTPTPSRSHHAARTHRAPQPPRPKSSIEQRMLMDKHAFEETQMRSQSRASGILEHHHHHYQHGYVQPPPEPSQRFKYYPPIPSPHDSQLDLAEEEVSKYFPTPSPRKTVPQPPLQPPPQHQEDYDNYQNVPSRRQSTGQFQGKRAESVTPMVAAASGLIDAEDVGEFKRSSSARLHRNKRNHPEMFNLDETKKREQREESMKRLLEWKQRMLQSPLTRKSSRNASRTQTPTNSDSPIPTMIQMENGAKPKHLEMNKVMNNGRPQPPTSQSSSEGQSKRISRKGSTASRTSRSRSSPRISNRPGDISSSDEDIPGMRQSRKRSKSQQSRGSRSSRSNSTTQLNSTEQQQQPEYINISSLEEAMGRNQSDLSVMNHPNDLVVAKREWNRKAIGPDAWYNDDFNFDKAQHSFADDPLLKQQYGQLLDLRYQVNPPQFYDDGQLDQATVQICHESEMEHKSLSVRKIAQPNRSNTWHGDKFAEELQIFDRKNDKPVLLQVKKELDQTQKPMPKRSLDSSKESWSPTKVIDEIRKVKEAPPKNVVQDRRKQFESQSSDEGKLDVSELNNALEEAQKEAEDRQKMHSKIVSDFALSDSKESSDGMSKGEASDDTDPGAGQHEKTLQKKKSVLELLSDFEKKTQQLQEEEKKSGSSTRRRVFSDTETMMYDTSSDENDSTFDATPVCPDDKKVEAIRKSSLPTILPSNQLSEVQVSEGQYMPMTLKPESSPADTYLQMTPTVMRKETSTTSIASSNSSMHVIQPPSVDEQGRRPSQSVVMEHLIQEFGPERAAAIMESFTDEPAPVQPSNTTQQPVESPRYQEIQEQKSSTEQMAAGGHYEYLFKATSDAKAAMPPSPSQPNYESVYHEIPEEVQQRKPIRSPEMLPDILGNAPAGRGNSSSEADDEGGSKERSLFEVSDTFTPASFFLEKKKAQPQQLASTSRDHIGSVNSLSSRELPQTPSSNNDDHASRRSFSYHEQQSEQAYNPRRASNSSSTASPFKNPPPNTFLRQGQDINLTYQSVYENDDPGFTSSSSTDNQLNQNQQKTVPYYVADIKRPDSIVPTSQQEPIKVMKRRAQTPDSFLLEQSNHQAGQHQGPIMNEDGVVRSRSLEGLLGDGPAGPRDSVQVKLNFTQVVPPSPSLRSTPLPARGRDPPPPPEGVPPLDISTYRPPRRHFDDGTADDDTWRESLRRASARVKQSPEHTLPPPKLIPPNPTQHQAGNPVSPHINGYVWDPRENRFYRLNVDPNPNPRLFHQQPFLDQGLPTHTNSEDAARIKQLQSLQRPKSVGPIGQNGPTDTKSMMGRPNSTLPTSANQGHPTFSHAPPNSAPAQRTLENPLAERDAAWQKRKHSFSKRHERIKRNVSEITAQDLLGKSHEELVLLLIHLRRQAVALSEAVEGCKAEVENLINSEGESSLEAKALIEDAELQQKELEEKMNRITPMINLVDNMVKLGSLYKDVNPADSHMVNNNSPTKKKINNNENEKFESELKKVHQQLETNQKLLEDLATEHSKWEAEVKNIKSHAIHSANIDLQRGFKHPSNETMEIEADLHQAQRNCHIIQKRIQELVQEVQVLHAKQDYLANNARPSPMGLAGAEPVPSKGRKSGTWLETDLDSGICIDKSHDVEAQIKAELKAKNAGSTYVNAYEEELHNYENTNFNFQAQAEVDNEEDEIQTVHSEGIRSEAPPLPSKPAEAESSEAEAEMYSLGELSEADERVKKYFGLLPKQQITEIKTVRMVKRDSKERSVSRGAQDPPTPLPPRGNYQNVHDFLTDAYAQNEEESVNYNLKANTLPKATDKEVIVPSAIGNTTTQSRSSISLAQYYHNKGKAEKKSNSAYERLFGISSRETSLSPPESPGKRLVKVGTSSGESSLSPIMSPVFKSDAARAIVQEVGVVSGQKRVHRRIKKRSMTITSSHPAVLEALHHQNAKEFARSRDDLDMEQALGPRGLSTPDVIKSALDNKSDPSTPANGNRPKINTNTIDNLFGVPEKITIPERYIPDTEHDEVSPEERQVRLKKADSIRKMLADQSAPSASTSENPDEEKKEREHLLALNQMIAQQVLQKRRSLPGSK